MSAAARRITKAPVSLRAIGRLNRALMKDQKSVHKARSPDTWKGEALLGKGEFFIADEQPHGGISSLMTRSELEAFAREKGALATWEEMTP
jgi:hypothetical protein